MARAETAGASHDSESIKGLAQSIAKPAYRRLLTAEPALRRAVPALIIAFLLTIGVGAVVQVLDHRRQAIADADARPRHDRRVRCPSGSTASRRQRRRRGDARGATCSSAHCSTGATAFGRRVLLTNADGIDHRARRPAPIGGRSCSTCSATPQPLTILGASAGVLEISLADGATRFATVRTLAKAGGQLAVVAAARATRSPPGAPTPR